LLIQAGTDVNQADSEGNCPLHLAVKTKSVDIVQIIIDSGADVGVRNKAGRGAGDGCEDACILTLLGVEVCSLLF
jgi:ankyrin repeat protein